MTIFKDVEVHAFGKVFFNTCFFNTMGLYTLGIDENVAVLQVIQLFFGYVVFFFGGSSYLQSGAP